MEAYNIPTENDNFYFDLGDMVKVPDSRHPAKIVSRTEFLDRDRYTNQYYVLFSVEGIDVEFGAPYFENELEEI